MNGFASGSAHKNRGNVHHNVPVYSPSEVTEKIQIYTNSEKEHSYKAMYSSLIGGIILESALMVIPIDDHMVHRGHGVFITAMLINGSWKFLCFLTKVPTICILFGNHQKEIHTLIKRIQGYRIYYSNEATDVCDNEKSELSPNVLSQLEAEEKGAYASIWVDEEGFIGEGPCANIAIVRRSRELLLPLSDKILSGCTSKRLSVLAMKLVEKGILKSVSKRRVKEIDARNSAEMMLVSSVTHVTPIIEWDGQPIGDGRVGELTRAISDLFWEDIIEGPEMLRTHVPYKELHLQN